MLKKLKRVYLIAFLTLLVSACNEVDLVDGKIPEKYKEHAEVFAGTYQGAFGGMPGELKVNLVEDNRLVISFNGLDGSDILGSDCGSNIGHVKKIRLTNSGTRENPQYSINGAVVDFDPNRCSFMVAGREIVMVVREVQGHIRFDLSLLEKTEWRRECRPEVDNNGRTRLVCENVPERSYLVGQFIKNEPLAARYLSLLH